MHVLYLFQVYLAKPDCDLYWHRRDYLAQKLPPDAYVSTTPGKQNAIDRCSPAGNILSSAFFPKICLVAAN